MNFNNWLKVSSDFFRNLKPKNNSLFNPLHTCRKTRMFYRIRSDKLAQY